MLHPLVSIIIVDGERSSNPGVKEMESEALNVKLLEDEITLLILIPLCAEKLPLVLSIGDSKNRLIGQSQDLS